jgi:UDP-N-acetylglucosamine acyltransferase
MNAHQTAIVSPKAHISEDVLIGPYAVIEDDVVIGPGCRVHANTYICTGTTIGAGCIIHMGACLGSAPQDMAYKGANSYLKIGADNTFREHVTVHRGTEEGSYTTIGDNNYFMCLSHIAHNCTIGNHVIIGNNSLLAGYVTVEDHAFISAACLVHQFVRIGRLSMIGGGVRINKDFPPFMGTAADNIVESYNIIGLRRAGMQAKERDEIKQAHRILYREGLSISHALEKTEKLYKSEAVKSLASFIKSSKRGICMARSNRNQTHKQ